MTSAALVDSPPDPAALVRLLGAAPVALDVLGGGRNSRVYRLVAPDGQSMALKAYFRHPGDRRDRLGAEFGALTFLRRQGLACVPAPLAADPAAGLALYEFVDGAKASAPTPAEVDQAAAFLVSLRELRARPGAEALPPASEARFALAAVADNVESRLQSLAEGAPALAGFLADELVPAWRAALARCRERCQSGGIPFAQELPPAARTLSPSDFGFHNALRRNGQLVFLDFEYFGWDDPAKMIADFLLHPGMDLAPGLRIRLAEAVLRGFPDLPGLRERVRAAHPLFAIKWCTILLNEFLPGALDRRRFAAAGTPRSAEDALQRQARQLAKTREKLQWIRDDHDPLQPAP
jgi:hypothetical protein